MNGVPVATVAIGALFPFFLHETFSRKEIGNPAISALSPLPIHGAPHRLAGPSCGVSVRRGRAEPRHFGMPGPP